MVEDNPKMEGLEALMNFCRNHSKIFIFGCGYVEQMLAKYLEMADQKNIAFVVSELGQFEKKEKSLFPCIDLTDFCKKTKINRLFHKGRLNRIGIIISTENSLYSEIVSLLSKCGFCNYFFVDEWNRRTITYKMTPRTADNFWLEVNLADHCNLNCQCCDHFSPIASPTFLNFEQYVKDINRLADLTNHHIGMMKLQGGEPLLNKNLIEYIKVTREIFPETNIRIFTDGLLLMEWGRKHTDFWQTIKEKEVQVFVTEYPISLKVDAIKEQIKPYGLEFPDTPMPLCKSAGLWTFAEIGVPNNHSFIKHSVKHPFDLSGQQEPYRFISCYQFNESIVLRNGRIYTCPMIPYVHHYNNYFQENLEVTEEDSIDIYKVSSYEEIAEFCTHRVPFCRYCAVQCRTVLEWKQSSHCKEEWTL